MRAHGVPDSPTRRSSTTPSRSTSRRASTRTLPRPKGRRRCASSRYRRVCPTAIAALPEPRLPGHQRPRMTTWGSCAETRTRVLSALPLLRVVDAWPKRRQSGLRLRRLDERRGGRGSRRREHLVDVAEELLASDRLVVSSFRGGCSARRRGRALGGRSKRPSLIAPVSQFCAEAASPISAKASSIAASAARPVSRAVSAASRSEPPQARRARLTVVERRGLMERDGRCGCRLTDAGRGFAQSLKGELRPS
jgi:hypothetical protein